MAIIAARDTDGDVDYDAHHHDRDRDDLRTLRDLIAGAKLTNGVVYQHDSGHSAGHHFG